MDSPISYNSIFCEEYLDGIKDVIPEKIKDINIVYPPVFPNKKNKKYQKIPAILSEFSYIFSIHDLPENSFLKINNNILDILDNLNFSHITILDISNCDIESFPQQINNLVSLRYLNCERNKIKNIEKISLPELNIFICFDNQLTIFPEIESPLSCLHIGKNNIRDIPYKKVALMNLNVFLYFDNPFDDWKNNKKLRILEGIRQQQVIDFGLSLNHYWFLWLDDVIKYNDNKKINIITLKGTEESIFEEYYMQDIIHDLLYF
jgi:Leucine-rich repeat (LRR) protein